jgi:glycosyltransferase involved in cell wall biosynthesis
LKAEPLFTVAVPTHRGGDYLKLCIESILGQTWGDFRLEVLENASEDGSVEWLSGLRDSRLRVWPSKEPLGIEANWQRLLELPKAKYLTIVGHDDVLDRQFLESVGDLIRRYPDATIYQTHFRLIDETGKTIRSCRPMPSRETAPEFLASRLASIRDSYGTGYVMRSTDYERVGGIPPFPQLLFADDALVLRLAQNSWKATSPEERFSYRSHSGSVSWRPAVEPALNAFEQYLGLVLSLAASDTALASVLSRYLRGYVIYYCRIWYDLLFREACEGDRAISKQAYERLDHLLRKFGGEGAVLPGANEIESLKWINQLPARRWAYRTWTKPRHDFLGRQEYRALSWLYRLSKLMGQYGRSG